MKIKKSGLTSINIKRRVMMDSGSSTFLLMSASSTVGSRKMCCNWQKMPRVLKYITSKRKIRHSLIWLMNWKLLCIVKLPKKRKPSRPSKRICEKVKWPFCRPKNIVEASKIRKSLKSETWVWWRKSSRRRLNWWWKKVKSKGKTMKFLGKTTKWRGKTVKLHSFIKILLSNFWIYHSNFVKWINIRNSLRTKKISKTALKVPILFCSRPWKTSNNRKQLKIE